LINTDRLSLRQIRNEDKEFIRNYLADEELSKYLPLERPYNEDEALKWLNGRIVHWRQHNFGTFSVLLNKSPVVIGYCGIEYVQDTQFIDVRYGTLKRYWGHGFAYEAALAVVQYGFNTLGFQKLYGAAVPQNIPSIRLLEKLRMVKDAEFNTYGKEVWHYSLSNHNTI
jgi:ribosomal-protein-alanine N-acetyltransferase